jgi:hypothetical protein
VGSVVSVTDAEVSLRLTVPIFATPAWIRAVTAADGLCQCDGYCGRKHTRTRTETAVRCDARQGAPGVMLHLSESGEVYCLRCFASIERAAKQAAAAAAAQSAAADQLDLLSLFD